MEIAHYFLSNQHNSIHKNEVSFKMRQIYLFFVQKNIYYLYNNMFANAVHVT